jgi:hypothetical protein
MPACESYQICRDAKCTPIYKGTTDLSAGQSITVRAVDVGSDGAYYVAGEFTGAVDFNPGAGIDGASGPTDRTSAFVTRFGADGSYGWTRVFLAGSDRSSSAVLASAKAAPDGTVVLVGSAGGMVDFDPGPGVDLHGGLFVAKFASSGTLAWTSFLENQPAAPLSVDTAQDGTILIGGTFSGMVDFDPGPNTDTKQSVGVQDLFGSVMTASGAYQWTRTVATT